MRNALWTAHQLLDVGSAKVDKRVLIFTCDPNPPGPGVTADTNRHAPPPAPAAPDAMRTPTASQSCGRGPLWICSSHLPLKFDRQRPCGLQSLAGHTAGVPGHCSTQTSA